MRHPLCSFLRILFTAFYLIELIRLYYATTPCIHVNAIPFIFFLLTGLALGILQLKNFSASKPLAVDFWQILYSMGFSVSFYIWGSLRGSTLGALKGALGLTATFQGGLPKASASEISCFAAHWSMSSYVLIDSRWASGVLLCLCIPMTILFLVYSKRPHDNSALPHIP